MFDSNLLTHTNSNQRRSHNAYTTLLLDQEEEERVPSSFDDAEGGDMLCSDAPTPHFLLGLGIVGLDLAVDATGEDEVLPAALGLLLDMVEGRGEAQHIRLKPTLRLGGSVRRASSGEPRS